MTQQETPLTILITGGTGFIGQHLLEELAGTPYKIRIFTRNRTREVRVAHPGISMYYGELADQASLEPALAGVDVIVNLAGEKFREEKFEDSNVKGTRNLIGLAEKHGVKKIIHLSSISVFGLKDSPKSLLVNDFAPPRPQTRYGVTKLQSERLLGELAVKGGAELIVLRAGPVFGEHQDTAYLLELLQRIKSGRPILRCRHSTLSLVYVKDLTFAIRHAIEKSVGNKTFIVAQTILFSRFVEITAGLLGVTCPIRPIPSCVCTALETFGYFGSPTIRARIRSVSGAVHYDDAYLKQNIGYRYGLELALVRMLTHYNLLPA
jgi:nucleoside-diphosphate-sugar epimerase